MAILDNLFASFRRKKVSPTETIGFPGTAVIGGQIQTNERDQSLVGQKRYETFSKILANTSIVAAGTRYFLNLTAKAGWTLEPTDHPDSERLTELASAMLFDDPITPWHRIVRRAAMYRFYGFSVQEWTARRRDDGLLTFLDVSPRAQFTIERWDLDEDGQVAGMVQRSPQTQRDIFIPRGKTLYVVDDTLSDSPEGMGLFRHLAEPASRLEDYLRLEGIGLETDLRGIPVGRGPFQKLAEMEKAGKITRASRIALELPLRTFVEDHVKTSKTGMLLDSGTYEAKDEAGRASGAKQWDVELMKGGSTSLPDLAGSIDRLNHEMARILGVEFLLLGSDSAGSFALSRDKTNQFSLLIDSTLKELAESIEDDLIRTLWMINGWPDDARPRAKTEEVKFRDVEQIAVALRDMAAAGAILPPDDPAINDVRILLGISPQLDPDEDDLALTDDETEGLPNDPDDDMPEDPEDNK